LLDPARMYRVLAEALRSPETELATVALRLLRALNDEQSASVLVGALAANAHAPSRLAAALNRMTVSYSPLLGPLLQHESQTVRFWAVLLAGRTGASQWTWMIRMMLTAREPMVRRAAVEAIGRIGSSDDRRLVLARFFDPSPKSLPSGWGLYWSCASRRWYQAKNRPCVFAASPRCWSAIFV
jgi:hypothetical protein